MHAATEQEIRPAWLRYSAASAYCGLGRTKLTQLVREGEVRAARLGRHVIICRESLDEYLERHA